MLDVEERVNHLDQLMAQLIQTVDRTSREMREFKQEMRLWRERSEQESHEFKTEMYLWRERSEQEMLEFKTEMRQSKRDLDKKWGELSNKLGTMAEDLVAPSVPRILKQITGCTEQIDFIAVRVKRRKPREQEFDVVAVCDKWVLINETKSRLKPKHIDDFYELMQKSHDYFPEFVGKQFIGAIASLYVDESLVRYGEKLGLIVLGFNEELMDILNSSGFVPKGF